MKNRVFLFSFVLFLIACKNKEEKQEGGAENKITAAAGSTYSKEFNDGVVNVLNAYYNLKDAFVASDTMKINAAGTALKGLLDGLKLDELKQKDSVAFESISGRPGDVASEITGMLGERDLEKKRESFEMISNAFYDMVRSIRPQGVAVYYQYCPMAFNDKGAYWLSNADSIRNPYFGKKMLTCGEVKETLKY
jgi:hypothetical protein